MHNSNPEVNNKEERKEREIEPYNNGVKIRFIKQFVLFFIHTALYKLYSIKKTLLNR